MPLSSQLTIHWHLQHSQEYHPYNHSWEPDSHPCDRSIEPHSWELNIHTLALQYNTYNCLPLVIQILVSIVDPRHSCNPAPASSLLLPVSTSTIDPLVTPIPIGTLLPTAPQIHCSMERTISRFDYTIFELSGIPVVPPVNSRLLPLSNTSSGSKFNQNQSFSFLLFNIHPRFFFLLLSLLETHSQ